MIFAFQLFGTRVCFKWKVDWQVRCLLVWSCAFGAYNGPEACWYIPTIGGWESGWVGKIFFTKNIDFCWRSLLTVCGLFSVVHLLVFEFYTIINYCSFGLLNIVQRDLYVVNVKHAKILQSMKIIQLIQNCITAHPSPSFGCVLVWILCIVASM